MKDENIQKPLKMMIPLEMIKIDKRLQHIKTPMLNTYYKINSENESNRIKMNNNINIRHTSEGRSILNGNRKMSYGKENVFLNKI